MKIDFFLAQKLILLLMKNISPDTLTELRDIVSKLEEKAKFTKNPFDDLLVLLIKSLLI